MCARHFDYQFNQFLCNTSKPVFKKLQAFGLLRSTLGERFVIFGDPVVDGIPVHARREDSRFLVTWTGDVQNLRHFE